MIPLPLSPVITGMPRGSQGLGNQASSPTRLYASVAGEESPLQGQRREARKPAASPRPSAHTGAGHLRGSPENRPSCAPAIPPMPGARPGRRSRRTHGPEPSQRDRGTAAGAPRGHAKGPGHQLAVLATHAHSPLGTARCSWLRWALAGAETLGRDLRAGRGLAADPGPSLRGETSGPKSGGRKERLHHSLVCRPRCT